MSQVAVRSRSGEPQCPEEKSMKEATVRARALRALPRVRYGNREYSVDARLREFRSMSYPPETIEFVPFDSVKGRRMRGRLPSEGTAPPHANPPT